MQKAESTVARQEITHEKTGSFSHDFAANKRWKLDEGLLKAIKRTLNNSVPDPPVRSVIDLGAGVGKTVLALREAGLMDVEGVDGIPGITDLSGGVVCELDLTEPYIWTRVYDRSREMTAGWRPDAAICIEVGEHVPPDNQKAFLDNVADAAKHLLIISYAVPGQRGHDHVSCHSPEWVAAELGARGLALSEDLTQQAREIAGKGWDKKLMVLRRRENVSGNRA